LHGTLARALHHAVCVFPKRARCPGCPLLARCTYPALFETPTNGDETLRAAGIRDQAPRPLVLAPEAGWTRSSGHPVALPADAEVPARITLIGRAIDDLPILVVALQHAAKRGLGVRDAARHNEDARQRAALHLVQITTGDDERIVYDATTDAYTPVPQSLSTFSGSTLRQAQGEWETLYSMDSATVRAEALEARLRIGQQSPQPAAGTGSGSGADTVALTFVTPLRLKQEGRFLSTVTPRDCCMALARRANALSLLHGSGEPAVDEAAIAHLAANVVVEETHLRRVHVTRYSARQRQRVQWPGLMGPMRWRGGALQDLWPLLRFGELVQVGKGAALGFGRYQIR